MVPRKSSALDTHKGGGLLIRELKEHVGITCSYHIRLFTFGWEHFKVDGRATFLVLLLEPGSIVIDFNKEG